MNRINTIPVLLAAVITIFVSCSRFDNIENRLDILEQKIVTLTEALESLQMAYERGKVITEVTSQEDGYKIIFSDNSSINILHGNNGITPILSTDSDGYWIVSYDDGKSFTRLLDKDGNPIVAIESGGNDGTDGKNGICVRVVIDEDENFVFEMYYSDDPDNVIERIETDYTSDKSKIISSIVENTEDGTIVITTADGKSFTFFASEKIFDIEDRLSELEQRVMTLEETVKVLEEAYKNGKVIVSVDKIDSGHKILFSDGSTIEILNGKDGENGKDGVIPIFSMDNSGCWAISYDNGKTFTKLQDNQGNDVSGVGEDGKNGISVRVVVNAAGYYTFELYDPADPDNVIDTIVTPLTSDKSQIISSITQNNADCSITITMANGDSFTFNRKRVIPSSIAILQTKPLMIRNDADATLEFRVNPSNADFNYNVNSEECDIYLDLVVETKSYVKTPSNYKLTKIEPAYDENGVIQAGQYKAHLTDLGLDTFYKDIIALVIRTKDENGGEVEISSSAIELQYSDNIISEFHFLTKYNPTSVIEDVTATIEGNEIKVSSPFITSATDLVANFTCNGYKVMVKGAEQESGITANDFSSPVTYRVVDHEGKARDYKVTVLYSGLPVVYVDTPNSVAITSKTEWTTGTSIRIVNPDGTIAYEGTSSFRGRGNGTWTYPKKPYAIKLDKKASVLGMPAHKRWVLLANWMDRTLMRNRVALKLGECTQMAYTPHGEYVEVVLNGEHIGNYFLCEQIKVDENRVNITDGYLLELDIYYDEAYKFKSNIRNFPYMFKDPDDDITEEMFNYVQGYVNSMEDNMYNHFEEGKWKEYLDLDSFVDYWFAVELTSNRETYHPKSVYMHKDKDGKLCAGPMWDYDWQTFIPELTNRFETKNYIYYPALFNDREFVTKVKERWPAAKANFDKIPAFIDSEAEKIRNSDKMNSAMWPITQAVNGDETMSFDEAVARLRKSYTDKLEWLDHQIQNM